MHVFTSPVRDLSRARVIDIRSLSVFLLKPPTVKIAEFPHLQAVTWRWLGLHCSRRTPAGIFPGNRRPIFQAWPGLRFCMTLFHFTGSAFRDDKNLKVQAPLFATEGAVSASCAINGLLGNLCLYVMSAKDSRQISESSSACRKPFVVY